MTVGKYYCDYCDKEFQDTPAARKRHLQGLQHQRNRKLWYDSLSLPQAPNQINVTTQTFGKGLCNRFLKTYGDSCKYFHPKHNVQSPSTQDTHIVVVHEELWFSCLSLIHCYLERHSVWNGEWEREYGMQPRLTRKRLDFVDNLQLQGGIQGHVASQSFGMSLGNLPPSLRPPPDGGYPLLPFIDWG
ncbi:zinc finger CCCH domain-containing protein 3 isoform X2 [Amaranthus tricolor]|uniref:zinc finger CCCH domain-containing protein 3 isoform X2 n=1 Tax=Amaranthus tricolor TaxID=29722 RepID=UPI00258F6248|nr:zinc finger CCCH domain-containing protein 3 isoform X2 [Amaranthus tricolor]